MISKLIPAKPKHPPTLMKLFDFTMNDLRANQSGVLSKRQIRIAESSQPNLMIQIILMGHVAFIIGILVVIVLASGVSTEKIILLALASMIIVSPFFIAMQRMNTIQSSGLSTEDLELAEVRQICGVITIVDIRMNTAKLKIGNQKFKVPKEVADLINQEISYCVHYTPHSWKLLSLMEQSE